MRVRCVGGGQAALLTLEVPPVVDEFVTRDANQPGHVEFWQTALAAGTYGGQEGLARQIPRLTRRSRNVAVSSRTPEARPRDRSPQRGRRPWGALQRLPYISYRLARVVSEHAGNCTSSNRLLPPDVPTIGRTFERVTAVPTRANCQQALAP
jgi:hypothetical protein